MSSVCGLMCFLSMLKCQVNITVLNFIILSQVCGFNVSMKLSYCYLSNFFMDPSIQIDLVETCSAIPLLNLSEVSFNFLFFSRLFLESPLVIVFFLLYPPIYACPCLCVVALISKNWNYAFLHFISVSLILFPVTVHQSVGEHSQMMKRVKKMYILRSAWPKRGGGSL